jgi:CMP-N-acetylneuraminic acid synthetase
MDIRNVENSIDIMEVFKAHSSMSVVATESNFYKHEGTGLVPLSNNKNLRLERDQMYQETGGIHSVEADWYMDNKMLHSDKVSHLIVNKFASNKIESEDDFSSLEFLYSKNKLK